MQPNKARADLWMDLALVAFLIGFDVAARLLPHAPGLHAGRRQRACSPAACCASRRWRVVVPLVAMVLSDVALAGDDWRITLVVYAAIAMPALAGMLTRRWTGALPVVAAMVVLLADLLRGHRISRSGRSAACIRSTLQGLTQCYVAALPFLDKTVMGDLFWTAVLFGGAWLVQNGPALARRAL